MMKQNPVCTARFFSVPRLLSHEHLGLVNKVKQAMNSSVVAKLYLEMIIRAVRRHLRI